MIKKHNPKFFNSHKNPNTHFKDNRERFRLFNSMHKVPNRFMFVLLSIISLILSIIPFVWPDAYFSVNAWIFWSMGLIFALGFENGANLHYMLYSRVAKEKSIDSIKLNIRINKIMRILSMLSWILITIGLSMMVITKSSSFWSLW